MNTSVSVILPVLNEAECIAEALGRIDGFHEIIVADGGSVDGTGEPAVPLANRVVQSEPGRARQMNSGARAATGDILAFLHADTILPDRACLLIAEAATRPGFVWGRFDVRIEGRSRWLPVVAFMMNRRSRLTGVATGDQAIFVKRDTFDALGGFPDIPIMEDIALSKLLRPLAPPVCIAAPVVTSGRRWDRNGALWTIGIMSVMRLCYWLGVSPTRLARLYANLKRG